MAEKIAGYTSEMCQQAMIDELKELFRDMKFNGQESPKSLQIFKQFLPIQTNDDDDVDTNDSMYPCIIVIETSGFPSSSAMVLDAVRKEGKVAHIGWANDLPALPVIPIMAKTLTIFGIGGNGGRGQYERALELVRSGRFDLDPLVTHRYSLDDVAEAFATASSKSDGAIKVVVSP